MSLGADTYKPLVLFTGFSPRWFNLVAEGLSRRYSSDFRFEGVLWPSTWGERIAFARKMRKADVIILLDLDHEFDSTTTKLWLNWLARHPRKSAIQYWIGTDAETFAQRHAGQNALESLPEAARAIRHIAASEVLSQRLASVGIDATTVIFPSPERAPESVPPLPHQFRVLGYWTDPRAIECGARCFLEAARAMPETEFQVMGATGEGLDAPKNVTFIGGFKDSGDHLRDAVVHVRQFAFDAAPGATVEEALYFGRYVLYSYEFPYTDYVAFDDCEGLARQLKAYKEKFDSGLLAPNLAGREFIEGFWDPDKRFAAIMGIIEQSWAEGQNE